jgi:arginine deiminase
LPLHVFSEVDPLRRVLVHRPGLEIDWMTPTLMGQLLFDDILDGEEARQEHDTFCAVLERSGAELVEPQRLLAEVLAEDGARDELLRELERGFDVGPEVVARLAELEAEGLAAALVHGVRAPAEAAAGGRQAIFDLPPIPNFFFQRDALVVLGDRTIVCSMATAAREREQLLARFLCARHPALAGAARFEIERPPSGAPDHDPHFPYPTLEGGDVVVANRDTVLVGAGERTNRRGVEILAEYLRREPTGFRHLVMVELPPRRSCMHLDTVFSFIDRGTCLAYLPVVEPGRSESAQVYYADLEARELAFAPRPSLLQALAGLGLELEVVPCGGADDPIEQQREQWTDGANAFALAPGVIVLYRRNHRTLEELARRGYRVLGEDEAASGGSSVVGLGRTVVALEGYELARARGGPRCMAMPLERADGDAA